MLEIIIHSLKAAWKNKKLWYFGLITAFLSGTSFVFSVYMDNKGESSFRRFSIKESAQLSRYWFLALVIFVILIIFACFLLVLAISAKNALITGTEYAEKNEIFSLKKGWKIGKEKFWRIAGLEIILSIISLAVYGVLISPLEILFKQKAFAPAILLSALALIIAIPFSLIIFFVRIFGCREIIFKNQKIFKAIPVSYNLFIENWKKSIIILLCAVLIIFSACFLLGILLITLFLPLFIFILLLYIALKTAGAIAGIIAIAVLILPIILFAATFLIVFKEILWTKFYNGIGNNTAIRNEKKN